MKTKCFPKFLAGSLLTGFGLQTHAFVVPPETYAPDWSGSAPYQRDIMIQFDYNPVAPPGPGIPDATYTGTLDPTLLSSDFVLLNNVQWFPSITIDGTNYDGVIGIDNQQGTSTLTGTATFHIDNTADTTGVKNFWFEEFWLPGSANTWTNNLYDPTGAPGTFLGGPANSTFNGEVLQNGEWQIIPNPTNETFVVSFSVPAGQFALLDELHIATECVPSLVAAPEPGTLSLLGLGLAGFALSASRRRTK